MGYVAIGLCIIESFDIVYPRGHRPTKLRFRRSPFARSNPVTVFWNSFSNWFGSFRLGFFKEKLWMFCVLYSLSLSLFAVRSLAPSFVSSFVSQPSPLSGYLLRLLFRSLFQSADSCHISLCFYACFDALLVFTNVFSALPHPTQTPCSALPHPTATLAN